MVGLCSVGTASSCSLALGALPPRKLPAWAEEGCGRTLCMLQRGGAAGQAGGDPPEVAVPPARQHLRACPPRRGGRAAFPAELSRGAALPSAAPGPLLSTHHRNRRTLGVEGVECADLTGMGGAEGLHRLL